MVLRRALKLGRGGLWHFVAVFVIASAAMAAVARAEDDPMAATLAAARAALDRGDAAGAASRYAAMPPGTPAFPARLHDAIRWQLLQGHAAEAWRIAELARRVASVAGAEVVVLDLDYLRALALLKSGVCTFTQPVRQRAWAQLLDAHIYRFARRFASGAFRADPYAAAGRGPLEHYIDGVQTHYLADIPNAEPLRGSGCPFAQSRLEDRERAQRGEFEALVAWRQLALNGRGGAALPGAAAVELRLAELATKEKAPDLAKAILARYVDSDAAAWRALPDPERRYLWRQLVETGLFEAPPYAPASPRGALVLTLVQSLEAPEAADWTGLLDSKALSLAQREALVTHLLAIPTTPERGFLLVSAAELAAARGAAPEALAFVRRLLLGGEGQGDDAAEQRAAGLAAEIFAEYRYDDAMLGAIQASMPAAQWGGIFRRVMFDHALTGGAKGFAQLQRAAAAATARGALRLSEAEVAILRALAERRPTDFARTLARLAPPGRLGGRPLLFLSDLGARVLSLTLEERRAASPYLAQIAEFLRARLNSGTAQQQLLNLIALYGAASESAGGRYHRGNLTVTEGQVAAGAVDLGANAALPWPFRWEAPSELPRRDLVVTPKTAGGDDWIIR